MIPLWSIKFDLCQIIRYILFQDDVISCTLFFSAFFILRTSMTRTTMAINRPNNVQINTPPRDRSVMPSESSKIGQSLLFVLFQYFPNKNCQLKYFRGIDVWVLLGHMHVKPTQDIMYQKVFQNKAVFVDVRLIYLAPRWGNFLVVRQLHMAVLQTHLQFE